MLPPRIGPTLDPADFPSFSPVSPSPSSALPHNPLPTLVQLTQQPQANAMLHRSEYGISNPSQSATSLATHSATTSQPSSSRLLSLSQISTLHAQNSPKTTPISISPDDDAPTPPQASPPTPAESFRSNGTRQKGRGLKRVRGKRIHFRLRLLKVSCRVH